MNALPHAPRNAGPWRAVAEFLDAQYLASFGLTRIKSAGGAASGASEAATAAPPAQSAPLGNHGDITLEVAK